MSAAVPRCSAGRAGPCSPQLLHLPDVRGPPGLGLSGAHPFVSEWGFWQRGHPRARRSLSVGLLCQDWPPRPVPPGPLAPRAPDSWAQLLEALLAGHGIVWLFLPE